jgi:hypothetical protein
MKTLDNKKKTMVGFIIIGICLAIICVLTISAYVLKSEAYDSETFCRGEVSAHTIVVLDTTDPLSSVQQRFVLKYIDTEKDKLRDYEKLSIFTLTENTYIAPEPIFSRCNPGNGKNANQLYQNPRKIELKFDRSFVEPLKKEIESIFSSTIDSKSPIFEIIRELSLRNDFSEGVQKKTLIIISDMMHHTSNYSHYRDRIDYGYFAKSSYINEVSANLHSVDVKIVYLRREKLNNLQGEQHLLFWKNYFQAMGADVVEQRNVR